MSVIERAQQVRGLAGRRVRRAQPSEPRAGTVTPLSVRTLTGGDVGIGGDVRSSYVQVVVAGARKYGSPSAADEFFPRSGPLTRWILRCRGEPQEADPGGEASEKACTFGGVHTRHTEGR